MRNREDIHRIEAIIGNLLRIGVALSALIVLVGASLHLAHAWAAPAHYSGFRGEPRSLTTLSGVASGVVNGSSLAIIQLGLLLLILTPIARVAFSLAAFVYEKDWLYSLFTLVVLSILAWSLFAH